MCNIPDYIKTAISRINEFLPKPLKISELKVATKQKIPFGLSRAYDYFEAELNGVSFIIAGVDDDEYQPTPSLITKQRDVLVKETELTPIFIFQKLEPYIFQRYSKNNLNIIIGKKQLFLPSLFLLANKMKPYPRKMEDKTPAFFQLLTLYQLEKERLDGFTMKDLAEKFNTSYATVNRAIRWMNEKGFIQLEGGKEKKIHFLYQGHKLWDKGLAYMETPIDFIVYTPQTEIKEHSIISELNALAQYTMLNGGMCRQAISKDQYKNLKNNNIEIDPYGECGIEVWKYDPALLSENGVVDKLSLYLMLREYEDERVQLELETLMNGIKW